MFKTKDMPLPLKMTAMCALHIGIPSGIFLYLKTGGPYIFLSSAIWLVFILEGDRAINAGNVSDESWFASFVLIVAMHFTSLQACDEIAKLMR